MGATASTNLINWFSQRLHTNCAFNSEGLSQVGPGSNPNGLKHRLVPPLPDDPYLQIGGRISRAMFIWDSPYQIIPSLFSRRIAEGHAIAITGKCPEHGNELDDFVVLRQDSFRFYNQFFSWTNMPACYPRLIVKFPALWANLDEVFREPVD